MITLGLNHNKVPVTVTLEQLYYHTAIFGASGSGKTGQVLSIVEQILEQNVPVLLVDIKSDLVNIIQSTLRDKLNIVLLTPGSDHGNTVDIFAKITDEKQSDQVIKCLLTMLGLSDSKSAEPYHTFLSNIIRHKFLNQDIELEELLHEVMNPSLKRIGMFKVDEVLAPKARKELALKLNNIISNPAYKLWRSGLTLDFDQLFKVKEGKTPLVIYSVGHIIEDSDKLSALASVFNEYYHWVLSQSGSKELRSLIVVDECHGLMPPHPRNPVTKAPLLGLLKQARAFGCGVLLATQNTKDIDYKGLSNCGTWITGKLATKNDRDRVIEGLLGFSVYDKPTLHNKIGVLQKREFMVACNEQLHILKSLDVKTPLSGPLAVQDLLTIRRLGYYKVIECGDKKSMISRFLTYPKKVGFWR